MLRFPDSRISILENVHALGERGHDPVLDAVVDHLHEVAGPRRAAVQVAELFGRVVAAASRRALDVTLARRDGLEDRLDPIERLVGAADHETVPPLETEHAAASTGIHVMDALRLEFGGTANVVAVVGVAAVDDDVAGLEHLGHLVDDVARETRGDHEPDRARSLELARHVGERLRTRRALAGERGHGIRIHVVDDAFVPVVHEAAHDVRAHSSESDHSQLHS